MIRRTSSGLRRSLAAVVASGVLAASLGVVASSAGASTRVVAAPSAFCTTLMTFHAKTPTGSNAKSYQVWAKTYLPEFKKLAGEAPNASIRKVLNTTVSILKYEASAANAKSLGAYISAHSQQWSNGWKAFAKAAVACATSLY